MKGKLLGVGYFGDVFEYGEGKVIKLMHDIFPPELAEREYLVSEEVHKHYPWSPAVYDLVELEGRYGIVFERIEGPAISDLIKRYSWNTKRYCSIMAEYHLKLHSMTSELLPTYEEVLERNLNRMDWLSDSQKNFIRNYVSNLPHKSSICHGDFHTDNIILKKGRVTVFDWCTAYSGHPLSDVVNMTILMMLPIVTKKMYFPFNYTAIAFKPLLCKLYIDEYRKRAGVSMEEINAWLLPAAVIRLGEGIPNGQDVLKKIILEQMARLGYSDK